MVSVLALRADRRIAMTALPRRRIGFALVAVALLGWPAGALAATGGLGSAAAAHPASRLAAVTASVQPPARAGSRQNDILRGISCVSRSFCMAGGTFTGPHGGANWLAEWVEW